jgi:hypothetical protein
LPQLEQQGFEQSVVEPLQPRKAHLWREEIGLEELVGEKDEQLKAGQMRSWLERRVEALGGDDAQIRENVPFCIPAETLHIEDAGWVYGAFDWLARLSDGSFVLLASGQLERVEMLAFCAQRAGLEVRESWIASLSGDELKARRITID